MEISLSWPNPGCKLTTLVVILQPPFFPNKRNKFHWSTHGHNSVHTHVLYKIQLDVNWQPWLSILIDNLHRFRAFGGGNVHPSHNMCASLFENSFFIKGSMARNLDTEIFKKSGLHGRDFPEQQNFLAPTGQLSKWVWDKNVGADTALEYVNRGVRCREV